MVKVQVHSLISSLKTYHPTSHFYPLVTGPVHSCAISTPLQIVHIAIYVLPGTYFHLSQVKHEVPCSRTQHLNNVPRLRGEKHDISLKMLHQEGFETARQVATSAERHALTIAPCPSHNPIQMIDSLIKTDA